MNTSDPQPQYTEVYRKVSIPWYPWSLWSMAYLNVETGARCYVVDGTKKIEKNGFVFKWPFSNPTVKVVILNPTPLQIILENLQVGLDRERGLRNIMSKVVLSVSYRIKDPVKVSSKDEPLKTLENSIKGCFIEYFKNTQPHDIKGGVRSSYIESDFYREITDIFAINDISITAAEQSSFLVDTIDPTESKIIENLKEVSKSLHRIADNSTQNTVADVQNIAKMAERYESKVLEILDNRVRKRSGILPLIYLIEEIIFISSNSEITDRAYSIRNALYEMLGISTQNVGGSIMNTLSDMSHINAQPIQETALLESNDLIVDDE